MAPDTHDSSIPPCPPPHVALVALMALALAAAGCGDGDDGSTEGISGSTGPASTAEPEKSDAVGGGPERWAAFCEAFALEADGFCTSVCVDVDPDCADTGDACEANGRYGDGWCDAACPAPDPDCAEDPTDSPSGPDVCLDELRYADGACDTDCAYEDPDCGRAVWSDALADWEQEVCARYVSDPRSNIRDFATSVCIERSGQGLVDCIHACVVAYEGHSGQ